jgi:hypothetical protein
VQDLTAQKAALDCLIFDSNPGGTTFTNNGAFDLADADIVRVVGVVQIAASNYIDAADNSVACVSSLAIPVVSGEAGTLYACFISNSATPTYTANELSVVFHFLIDEG